MINGFYQLSRIDKEAPQAGRWKKSVGIAVLGLTLILGFLLYDFAHLNSQGKIVEAPQNAEIQEAVEPQKNEALLKPQPNIEKQTKSDKQMAQELIYGKWAKANSSWVKYEFNENNLQILNVAPIDPYGENNIAVKMRNNQGQWMGFNTLFIITFKNNQYHLQIIQRRPDGNEANGYEDQKVDFIKVYWEDKD
ncbi:MAG TPA: hypothetical protein VN379_22845 [Sporomusa sp.]|nr:hypothetical protein [Sporomusa sp.]